MEELSPREEPSRDAGRLQAQGGTSGIGSPAVQIGQKMALPDPVGLRPHFILEKVHPWVMVTMGLRKVSIASLQRALGS